MTARILTPRLQKRSGVAGGAKHLPKPYKLRRYYTPAEVKVHNNADDCWVTFFNQVYDLTPLIQDNYGALCEPIIKAAGSDITHWFDPKSKEPRTQISAKTGLLQFHCPQGRFLHIPPFEPDAEWNNDFVKPWWHEEGYCIGSLTTKTRKIRIINMLTHHDTILEVCSEETINEILDRYMEFNEHAASYTWKRLKRPLDMDKNLQENDIPDETEQFLELGIDLDSYIPAIHIYFNDDLKYS